MRAMDRQPFQLSNTILYCRRWAETVDFYRGVLGLPVNVEKDWFVEFRLTDESFVSVADAARASIDTSAGQGITLALQVADIEAVHRRLSDAGVDVPPVGRHPWGARSFYCRDPEGYRLEFWQPLE
jgi:catechol 2,3-dioxygenase-like lactoylglutathione lyase family enzyme